MRGTLQTLATESGRSLNLRPPISTDTDESDRSNPGWQTSRSSTPNRHRHNDGTPTAQQQQPGFGGDNTMNHTQVAGAPVSEISVDGAYALFHGQQQQQQQQYDETYSYHGNSTTTANTQARNMGTNSTTFLPSNQHHDDASHSHHNMSRSISSAQASISGGAASSLWTNPTNAPRREPAPSNHHDDPASRSYQHPTHGNSSSMQASIRSVDNDATSRRTTPSSTRGGGPLPYNQNDGTSHSQSPSHRNSSTPASVSGTASVRNNHAPTPVPPPSNHGAEGTTSVDEGEEDTSLQHYSSAVMGLDGNRKKRSFLVACLIFLLVAVVAAIIVIFLFYFGVLHGRTKAAPVQPVVPAPPDNHNKLQPRKSTMETVNERGWLNCGVVEHPGFSQFNDGTWSGFEVDLCRAIAAALFQDDGYKVNFTSLSNENRLLALQTGQVDVLAAMVTFTMERDLYEPTTQTGFTFSVPYLYNGVSFAGEPKYVTCAEQRNITGNCSGIVICVQANTTHEQVVESFPSSSTYLAPSLSTFYSMFAGGTCNVLAGEQFNLAQSNVVQAGFHGNYSIGEKQFSKEPISLVTREDDPEWSDYVNWVLLALLSAEQKAITQLTAKVSVQNPGPTVETSQLAFYHAVAGVGNYGEMYDQHLKAIVPRAAVNQLNNGTTPLIYSFPLGNPTAAGPGPVPNGTLQRILDRGYLICGTSKGLFFAKFNPTTQEWQGHDIDLCRALSAAIFNGEGRTIFVQVSGTERWQALANGTVDVLSGDMTWNYERDNRENVTGTGFTFTQPVYYTGMQFGGIPKYEACAQHLDVRNDCSGLIICVKNGTTNAKNVANYFPPEYISAQPNGQMVVVCLQNGIGNVIAADGFLTATPTLRDQGYFGPYATSPMIFSREVLSLVTRQDDPQWSSFVNWVVMATFYAEEQNISQERYMNMTTTNLFGPSFSGMLQNAILAVGSHKEILTRNAEGKYNISAINELNTKPFGPLHYPPAGVLGL